MSIVKLDVKQRQGSSAKRLASTTKPRKINDRSKVPAETFESYNALDRQVIKASNIPDLLVYVVCTPRHEGEMGGQL